MTRHSVWDVIPCNIKTNCEKLMEHGLTVFVYIQTDLTIVNKL